jgi:hypothetical protein
MRIKVLAKDIDKGITALNALHARAYDLYAVENSLPDWANHPEAGSGAPDTGKQTLGAEGFTDFSQFVSSGAADSDSVRQSQVYDTEDGEEESQDIIDLKLRRQVY